MNFLHNNSNNNNTTFRWSCISCQAPDNHQKCSPLQLFDISSASDYLPPNSPHLTPRPLVHDGTISTLMRSVQREVDYAEVHGRRSRSNWQPWLETDPSRKRKLMEGISALLCWWNVRGQRSYRRLIGCRGRDAQPAKGTCLLFSSLLPFWMIPVTAAVSVNSPPALLTNSF